MLSIFDFWVLRSAGDWGVSRCCLHSSDGGQTRSHTLSIWGCYNKFSWIPHHLKRDACCKEMATATHAKPAVRNLFHSSQLYRGLKDMTYHNGHWLSESRWSSPWPPSPILITYYVKRRLSSKPSRHSISLASLICSFFCFFHSSFCFNITLAHHVRYPTIDYCITSGRKVSVSRYML